QQAVVDEGQRLGVAGRDQEDYAAIGAGLAAVFVLGPVAVGVLGPGDDVGFHADGKIAVVGALHGAPAEIAVLALAWEGHVEARPVDGAAGGELAKRLLLHANAVVHGEELRDEFIIDDEHGWFPMVVLWLLATGAGARNSMPRQRTLLTSRRLPPSTDG